MSTDVIKYAFIAGELSPTLFGRTDLTKFDFGMAEAKNFFVDYRGGLCTRPGSEFCEHVRLDTKPTRMVGFAFNPDEEDTYVLVFGDSYIRFMQSGNYVLETAKVVTAISGATPAVVTSVGHGLTAGRWVRIGTKTYEVRNPLVNTFDLYAVPSGAAVSGVGLAVADAYPIYEITSPYAAEDLDGLKFDQYRDRIRITSLDYDIHDLTRNDHTDWVISTADISPFYDGPTITSSSSSVAGSAQVIFAVTGVTDDGTESVAGTLYKITACVNYPVTEGAVSIKWAPDPDYVSYNVYRSVVSVTEVLSYGTELGYVGNTRGTKFTDPNIIPNFGRVPPTVYDPFQPGAITSVTVTAGGAGYPTNAAVTITDGTGAGAGYEGYAIIDDAGAVVRIVTKNPGHDYATPVVAIAGGAGATADATARSLTGTFPSISRIFQQRQVFAASLNAPITVWGSQYKRFDNFNSSDIVLDTDSFEFDLDTAAIAPIRHLLVTRGGLLAMTQENVWLLTGGGDASSRKPLTPSNALADPQTYTGVSELEPIRVGSDILYVEGKGYSVRLLAYNELNQVYGGQDKSILSSHLFGKGKELVRWAFQESPYKTVWAVRADGALLAFTIVQEEEVFAWTPCETRGRYLDVVVVKEGTQDRVYVTVERYIAGRWTKFIERFDLRLFVNVEDAWCVDCGLALSGTSPAGTVTLYRDEDDNYTASISGGVFTGAVNKYLRAGDGIFKVLTVPTATTATLHCSQPPTNFVPETDDSYTFPILEGDWTLDAAVSTLFGLDHLEGETVSILGDGNVFPQQVVTSGAVTLDHAVTRAIVGLPYACRAKTLPLIIPDSGIEAKRKRVVAVALRLDRSRGLLVGDSYDTVYAIPERTDEAWGAPTRLQDGFKRIPLGTTWDEDAHTYFLLEDPLPATLLSLVQDIEVGDEPD